MNKAFKMKDIKMLIEKALANVTVEEWVNAFRHTEKVEKEYWRMDFFPQNAHYPSISYQSRSARGFRN